MKTLITAMGCGTMLLLSPNSARGLDVPVEASVFTISVDPTRFGLLVNPSVLGVNDFVTAPASPSSALLAAAGFKAIRYPGGSESDLFDWRTATACGRTPTVGSDADFTRFMSSAVLPKKLSVEVTVNYGSSDQPECDAPGSPELAARWVREANVRHHYHIQSWEIGNEVWGSWEKDLHQPPHDAATFSAETTKFYSAMKAEDPTIKVGVPLVGYKHFDAAGNDWDSYVLSHATYDYVAIHFYDGSSGLEDDDRLLQDGPAKLIAMVERIRLALGLAGRKDTPISISEWNSVFAAPGKQSVSIVNGLFAGEILGTMLELGIDRAEFWNDFGCEFGGHGNYSASLYGWQQFGSLGALSEGVPFQTKASGCYYDSVDRVPINTSFPTARAFELLTRSGFVASSEQMLHATVEPTGNDLRAYAVTHKNGYGILVINLSQQRSYTVRLRIIDPSSTTNAICRYHWFRYGKAQYDLTRDNGPWVGLLTGYGKPGAGDVVATLPPWSMTVYILGTN